jgi:hypothetical protein
MKSTGKKNLDTKSSSKNKQRQPKKSTGTPMIERDHSFSDQHQERHRPFGIDHEPGVI